MPKKGFTIPEEGAELIRQQLKAKGFSQEQFAPEYLGVSDRTLRNWLSQKTTIDEHNLENLLMHLGIGVEDVFGDKLPRSYQDKSTLSRLIGNFRRIVMSGDITKAVAKYKNYIQAMAQHVSFHRIPPEGPFTAIEHDETWSHHYCHVEVKTPEPREEATYVLSFQFLKVVRVNIGHIVVTKDTVTAKPFFQKYSHEVKRNWDDPNTIHFAMWFANDGSMFFVETTDGKPFTSTVAEMLTESEYAKKESEIAVFWKGVWH